MNDCHREGQAQEASVGLCSRCLHTERVTSARGSRFYLCRLSFVDSRFPRYPPLPVLKCSGFSPQDGASDAS